MHLMVTTQDGSVFPVDVPEDMTLQDFFALCKYESDYLKRITTTGASSNPQSLPNVHLSMFFDGKSFSDTKMTLKEVGLKSDDLLMVKVNKIIQQNTGGTQNTETNSFPSLDFSSIRPFQSNANRRIATQATASNSTALRPNIPAISDQEIRNLFNRIVLNPNHLAMLRENQPELASAIAENNFDRFATIIKWQAEEQKKAVEERAKILADPLSAEAQNLLLENIHRQQIDEHMQIALEHTPEAFASVHMLYVKCKINGHDIKAFVDSGAQTTIMSESCARVCNVTRLIDKRFMGLAKGVGTSKILGRIHVVQLQIGNDFLATSCTIIENQGVDLLLGLDMMKKHQCCIDLHRNVFVVGTTGTVTPFLPESELPSESADSTAPPAEIRSEDVDKLQQMGFGRKEAELALKTASGDLDRAAAVLLAKGPSSAT